VDILQRLADLVCDLAGRVQIIVVDCVEYEFF